MDSDEREVVAEVQEPAEEMPLPESVSPEPMEEPPLPETAPPELPEFVEREEPEGESQELHVPEPQAAEDKPDPDWDELMPRLEAEEIPEEPDDPYGRAMADMDWRTALQQREQLLA